MEFYREGFLQKAGKGIQKHVHSWRPRYFVLDGLTLKYYKCKEILPENLLGCINVREMESVSVIKNEKRSFQITTEGKRTYYMAGKSEDEMQGWIKCLEMAKEKCSEMQKQNSEPVPSTYDEVNFSSPTKPPRSLIGSGAGAASPPPSPKSPTTSGSPPSSTPATATPVMSAYCSIAFPGADNKADPHPSKDQSSDLHADPTYDTVNEKASSSSNSSNPPADLYDTVNTTATSPSKKGSRASDPLPCAAVPPPLPARLPSMSGEVEEIMETEKNEDAIEIDAKRTVFGLYEGIGKPTNTESEKPQVKQVCGVYGEVGSSQSEKSQANGNSLYDEVGANSPSKNTKPQQTNDDLYDEIGTVDVDTNSEGKENESQEKGFALYDEVITQDDASQVEQKNEEKASPLLQPDPTHVYAKPDKKSSMKRERSKRKLIPGLMDVGEVDIDIEVEAAGGRETLERGMTKPQGDRFAIEELREILGEFDKEDNNNEHGQVLSDFDVNQGESAFEVLRMFLQKYE